MMAQRNPFLSSKGEARSSCFLALLLLTHSNFFHFTVLADDIFISTSSSFGGNFKIPLPRQLFEIAEGKTFHRSPHEPNYKVQFHSARAPFHPDSDQESMVMSNKEGQSYMCFLPIVEETKSVKSTAQPNSSSITVETDRTSKLKTPDELIEALEGLCFYRHENWWSYEFCYNKYLRQFHIQDDKISQEFILGLFDPEATAAFNQNQSDISRVKNPQSVDASQRYHAHQYTNGNICDHTDQPRKTEVRFVCSNSAPVIRSVKEISTCKYEVILQSPVLCKHP